MAVNSTKKKIICLRTERWKWVWFSSRHGIPASLSAACVFSLQWPQCMLCRVSIHPLFLLSPKFRPGFFLWILAMNFHKTLASNHLIIIPWDLNLKMHNLEQFPKGSPPPPLPQPPNELDLQEDPISFPTFSQGSLSPTSFYPVTTPKHHVFPPLTLLTLFFFTGNTPYAASVNWNIIQRVQVEDYHKCETIMILTLWFHGYFKLSFLSGCLWVFTSSCYVLPLSHSFNTVCPLWAGIWSY